MSPLGAIFVWFSPKTGTNLLHPRPPLFGGTLVVRFDITEPLEFVQDA